MITVFTPTYNRGDNLKKLFNSLQNQTFSDFEWLIVDDGSTDQTEEIVCKFMKTEIAFSIVYVKQKNGGKHRAINKAVTIAKGSLFFIVDSDDWLPIDSLEICYKYYMQIKDDDTFAGIAGLRYDSKGKMFGQTFLGEYVDATSLQRKNYSIVGEKAEAFKTKILEKYPFPEFEGENFLSEDIIWHKIAANGLRLRWFNRDIYHCEYLPDGLTNHLRENYRNNPIGYLTYIGNEINYQKVNKIKKYIWCGKCIFTIDISKVDKELIYKLLNINRLEYLLGILIYRFYRILK